MPIADTDPDRGEYLNPSHLPDRTIPSPAMTAGRNDRYQNIKPKRFWVAAHDATRYAVGFGDKEIAIMDDRFMANWMVQALNTRLAEDDAKVSP